MKVTSVWSFGKEPKLDWVQQLNVQRWCVFKETGMVINHLNIAAIWRDWSKNKAYGDNYPPAQCSTVSIPVWSIDNTEKWIIERVEELERAKLHEIKDITPCSSEEIWEKPTVYALMKGKNKRAVKLYYNSVEAGAVARDKGLGYRIEIRHGERTRCKGYCPVSEFCPAYQEYLKSA